MDEALGCLFLILVIIAAIIFFIIAFWQYILLFAFLGLAVWLIAKYPKEIKNAILVSAQKIKELSETFLGFLFFKYRNYQEYRNHQEEDVPPSILSAEADGKLMTQEKWVNPNDEAEWSEKNISVKLLSLQDRPQMFQVYVDSLVERFVNNQNAKIAQSRLNFLEQQVKILEVADRYGDLQNKLAIKKDKFENEQLEVKNEKQRLHLARKNEVLELSIKRLEDERRRLEEEVKIARLRRELEEIKSPSSPSESDEKQQLKEQIRELETKRLVLIGEKTEKLKTRL